MKVRVIKEALENARLRDGQYIVLKELKLLNGEVDLQMMNFVESEFTIRVLGKSPEHFVPVKEIDYSDKDEENLAQRIIYGHYRPCYDSDESHEDLKVTVNEEVDKWLVSITDEGYSSFGAGFADIEIVQKPTKARCPHCEDPHEVNFVAFAALVNIPDWIDLTDPTGEPVLLFTRHFNLDLATDFLNRTGIYVLNLQETEIPIDIKMTDVNWRDYIDLNKANLFAQYI